MSVTNLFNKKVGDQPIAVVDNFFDEDVLQNWLYYYQHTAQFKFAVEEVEDGDALFCHCLELPTVESIFRMSETLMPYVHEYNRLYDSNIGYTDMCRAHVNLFQIIDTFAGHTDSNDQGIVILWFANPHLEDTGGGFYLGEGDDQILVENKYNRLVVFPATMWHKVQQVFNRNSVRLSVYLGFAQFDINESRSRNFKQANLINKFTKQGVAHG